MRMKKIKVKKQHRKSFSQGTIDLPMDFEQTLGQFLGTKKAHQSSNAFFNDKSFRKWFRRCIPLIRKRIYSIGTSTENKEVLIYCLTRLNQSLDIKNQKTEKEIIIQLFLLISYLLGLRSGKSRVEVVTTRLVVRNI
ncbi:MAG: hypothetical protein Q7R75_02410 [bacterium]|nr:hypothetical protein [bacterium]